MAAARIDAPGPRPDSPTDVHSTPRSALEASTSLLREGADDGLVCPDIRALALALGTTTVAVRRMLARLVADGELLDAGRETYALPGTPAAELADDEETVAAGRTPPHDAVHDGTGSTMLW